MIGVELQVKGANQFVRSMGPKAKKRLGDAVEKVGRKLERDAKQYAPYVHGNLRRSIDFKRSGEMGEVRAKANYSAYVHGTPYHESMRKTTPFFTMARDRNQRFAEKVLDQALSRAITDATR